MPARDLVKEDQVENVVEALVQLIKKSDKSAVSLIDSGKKIDLQIILSAVPSTRHKFKLSLPHSLDEDSREVCLFVKDLDKNDREYEKTVDHYETLFKKKGVTKITKIIPIKALRTDYCEMPMKRTLSKAYDLFLADGKIMSFLPGLLGKIFFNRKKSKPIQVNLEAVDLKEHLDKVISNPVFELAGTGSTASVQVGHDKMSVKELTDNTLEALRVVALNIPGGRCNLKKVSMRCSNENILPLYLNVVNPKDIVLLEKKVKMTSVIDDVTTVEEGLVHVRADGFVKVVKRRKRKSPIEAEVDEKKPKLEMDVTTETGKKKKKAQKLTPKVKDGKKNRKKTTVDNAKKTDDSDSEIKEEVIEIKEEEAIDGESKDNITVKTSPKMKSKKSKENINSKTKKRKVKKLKAKDSDVIELEEEEATYDDSKDNITVKTTLKTKSKENINSKTKKRKVKELKSRNSDVIELKEEITDDAFVSEEIKLSEVDEAEPRKKKGKQNANVLKQKKPNKGVDKKPLKGSQVKVKGTQKKQTKVPGKKSFKGSSKG